MQTTAANEACIIRGWEVVANDKGVLTNCFMSHHRYTSADVEREKCGVQVDDLRTLLRTCFFFVGSGPFLNSSIDVCTCPRRFAGRQTRTFLVNVVGACMARRHTCAMA